MGFVRTKTIKGTKYAYFVENKWTKKGPRQKTKGYLGKVYSFRRQKQQEFFEFYKNYDLKVRSKKEILKDLIKLELFNHGFWREGDLWVRNNCFVDIKKLKCFNDKGKNIAISINEGLLCKPLVSKVLKLQIIADKEEPEKEGYALAKLLVESGLKIHPEVFIRLYELTKIL